MSVQSVSQILSLYERLQPSSDTPLLDVELLLAHVLDVDRTWLKTWPDHQLREDQIDLFNQLFSRRLNGEPIAFIIGVQGFWTLDLKVTPATLIPRPETELLVESALELDLPTDARVLDLGTGTGAITLALASERPLWQLTGVDSEPAAVKLAELNRQHCQLDNVTIYQSDWYSQVPIVGRLSKYNLIISNPPYIEIDDPHLTQGDVRFEPASALISGADGLDDLRQVIGLSTAYLESSGWLMVEHGSNQGEAVRALFYQCGFVNVQTLADFNSADRVTMGCWSAKD